jgi:hypothetical protein
MALPKQVAPSYTTVLPSNNEEVLFRPMTMKQQKSLLIALESEDNMQMLRSMRELLASATDDQFDAMKAPIVDLEWLFLQVRAKSVGETVDLNLKCAQEECNGSSKVSIDLTTVGIKRSDEHENHMIMLTEDLGLNMRYPTPEMLSKMQSDNELDQLTEVLKFTIVSIFDKLEVHHLEDADTKEVEEFFDSLTMDQIRLITDYFDRMPKLSHSIDTVCDACGHKGQRVLEGIASFF